MTGFVDSWFYADTEEERNNWMEDIDRLSQGMENPAADYTVKKDQNRIDDFDMLKVLVKGEYGKVVMCKEKETGETVAIKMFRKDMIGTNDEILCTVTEQKEFHKTKHPFLSSLKYSFQMDNRFCIVMEYVNGGNLFFHLSMDKRFAEEKVCFYGAEITLAIQHLHNLGVVYNKLTLENLLLDADGHIKLTDLSLVYEVGNEVSCGATTKSFDVLPPYLPPEVLEDTDNGRAGDWWGVGVVMYEMMCGKLPFYSRDQEVMFELILNEEVKFPARLSEVAKALLSGLLQKDPAKRLGGGKKDAEEVKQHFFFKSINFQDLYDKKIPAPFKPEVKTEIDTSNFAAEFTDEDLELTAPDKEGRREFTFDPEDVAKHI